jgi:hypothetical protein
MRTKLQRFTDFTGTLLPHETRYLLSIQQFQDAERLAILERVDRNARQVGDPEPYATRIDKRKYNHLQNWIQDRLRAVDVDAQLEWMLTTEQQISTDSIEGEEEKALLKAIREGDQPLFFFTKFYELVEQYRHFLLIRLRYADHALVDGFLRQYQAAYQRSKAVHEKLHRATLDIVDQYSGEGTESGQWEDWLVEIFYDEELDGHLRYLALVRLTFLCYNYRRYDLLREPFAYLDDQFAAGRYYSKRLLLNYYNNRLMLHSHYREYDAAVYYGYLSVRAPNHDYPLYVNNLCAVLLRLERNAAALELMQEAGPRVKKTSNLHNRVSFVAFYMEALIKNGRYRNAENYGDIFLQAYAKEVLRYRWHLFFSVYLEALVRRSKYEKVLQVAQKYQLLRHDETYRSSANYLPVIPLVVALARYREDGVPKEAFREDVRVLIAQYRDAQRRPAAFEQFLTEFSGWSGLNLPVTGA